jgi:hypothetical protein
MSTTSERRYRRQQQRLKEKLHKKFIERIKGKSNEEILQIMDQIRFKYGIEYRGEDNVIKQEDGQPNY